MTWNVITAPNMDRRYGLPALPDECIDSIVTDPPAGISFMGKEWDSNKGGRDVWIDWLFTIMSQCYRVLKPGGHMLVWALPRTSHWTATAIEDAGFEIRDVIHHLFSTGFPKSLNVGKAVQKLNKEATQWDGFQTALKPAVERWVLAIKPAKSVERCFVSNLAAHDAAMSDFARAIAEALAMPLFVNVFEKMDMSKSPAAESTPLNIVLSWRRILDDLSKLGSTFTTETKIALTTKLKILNCFLSVLTLKNITEESIQPNGLTSPVQGAVHLFTAFETLCKKVEPFAHEIASIEAFTSAHEFAHLHDEEIDEQMGPSGEHWILARKPIEKTVGRNVLLYGTGALNIDACRIGEDAGWSYPNGAGGNTFHGQDRHTDPESSNGGRWPANLILSHGPDCEPVGKGHIRGDRREGSQGSRPAGFVDTGAEAGDGKPSGPLYGDESVEIWNCAVGCPVAELDHQSGVSTSAGGTPSHSEYPDEVHGFRPSVGPTTGGLGDTGGASRFFATFKYQAKPSRNERDAGLDAFEASTAGEATDRKDGSKGLDNPRAGAGRTGGAKNTHATVKSIALMGWLTRLITPPGGVVLDPFCGSGSTGCACVIDGFDFLGFELDEKHAALARARIKFWEEWEAEQAPLLKTAGVDEKVRFEQLDMTERLQQAAAEQFFDKARAHDARKFSAWDRAMAMAAIAPAETQLTGDGEGVTDG